MLSKSERLARAKKRRDAAIRAAKDEYRIAVEAAHKGVRTCELFNVSEAVRDFMSSQSGEFTTEELIAAVNKRAGRTVTRCAIVREVWRVVGRGDVVHLNKGDRRGAAFRRVA